jgi:hypothetical protein
LSPSYTRRPTGLAFQRRRVELAAARILEHAVDHAIRAVTRREHTTIEQSQRGGWQVVDRVLEGSQNGVEVARHQPGPVVRWRAGDDAVVVGREPLRLHQAFISA